MQPAFEEAYRATIAALSSNGGAVIEATPTAAPPAHRQSVVHNVFNVNVSVNGATGAAGVDPESLEDAIVAMLRNAARRHGLEV